MTQQQAVSVRIIRRVPFSAERVFDAWLDPQMARQFLFATPAGQMVRVEIDARVGGKWVITERRDGLDAEHFGEYLEIDRPRRLVFTFGMPDVAGPPDRVTINITSTEEGCELTLTHEMKPEWREWAGKTESGWNSIIDGLARALADFKTAPSL